MCLIPSSRCLKDPLSSPCFVILAAGTACKYCFLPPLLLRSYTIPSRSFPCPNIANERIDDASVLADESKLPVDSGSMITLFFDRPGGGNHKRVLPRTLHVSTVEEALASSSHPPCRTVPCKFCRHSHRQHQTTK